MSTDMVVDVDRIGAGPQRLSAFRRMGAPLGGVVTVIAAILSIVLYSEGANRAGVLLLSDDLLASMQQRIGQEVIAYLTPASRVARLARSMIDLGPRPGQAAALQAFGSSALREVPQIDAVYSGDAQGNFFMVERSVGSGVDTEWIRNAPNARTVEWVHYDPDGQITGRRRDSADAYDPRNRDWYRGAIQSDEVFWTGVYVFFTKHAPGITVAVRYNQANGDGDVFGVDITLEALSAFLGSLKIGRHGRAVIIDDAGHLVAGPDMAQLVREQSGELVTARVDEAADPVMAAAYDHFRVEGYGRRIITVGDTPVVSISSKLPTLGRTWSLLMVVPESDFTGFVASNTRTTLWLSLTVVAVIIAITAFVVRQGLRADRTARRLLERGQAIERQRLALQDLSHQSMFDRSQIEPLRSLTKVLADLSGARRVGIWQLLNDGRMLDCEDAYERERDDHLAGLRLTRPELPQFFAALDSDEEIHAADASGDPRTAEFQRVLMHTFRSARLHVVPIRTTGRLLGAITLEDATQLAETDQFVALAANLLAIRLSRDASVTAVVPTEDIVAAAATGEQNFECDLVPETDAALPDTDKFRSVAVMQVRISDDTPMATRVTAENATLGDRLGMIVQDVAIAHNIPYVKLVGYQVTAAADLTSDDPNGILRLADASVAVRERCLALFQANGLPPSFQLGLDYGSAAGNYVGHEPRLFNLWGSAVYTAELLARTGTSPGMIQVSEAAYRRLREHFVFRLRGTFYLPGVGPAQTFVLASRQ